MRIILIYNVLQRCAKTYYLHYFCHTLFQNRTTHAQQIGKQKRYTRKKPATRNVTFRTTERLISKRTPSHVLTKGRKIEQNIVFRFVFFVFRYIFIGIYFENQK